MRYRGTLQYDGTAFHGWQIQPDVRTVQGEVERAVSRLEDREVRVESAGRTDRGVHAVAQEICFETRRGWEEDELLRALNAVLPEETLLERLRPAADGFHPRFDARRRRYEYYLQPAGGGRSPLRRDRVWTPERSVDAGRLSRAASPIPGERSFEAFAKSGQPERGTRCRVSRAEWSETAMGDLRFSIEANRFLHHMVRYLVSTMVEEATGRREPGELESLLSGDGQSGPGRETPRPPSPAPPQGLYLTGVRYGDGWNRPAGVPGLVADVPDAAPAGSGEDAEPSGDGTEGAAGGGGDP